jgi:hypothetical protein
MARKTEVTHQAGNVIYVDFQRHRREQQLIDFEELARWRAAVKELNKEKGLVPYSHGTTQYHRKRRKTDDPAD